LAAWLNDLGLGTRFAFRISDRICLATSSPYGVRTRTTNGLARLPLCVTPSHPMPVSECWPIVHHLRFSASA